MIDGRYWKFLVSGLVSLGICTQLSAQVALEEEAVGVQYSILPVVGYKSDLGFMGGGLLQRIDYGEGVRPFLNSTSVEMTVSTKGHLVSVFDHERLNSLGMNIRSRVRIEGLRILRNTYFGIGNDTPFSASSYEDGYYFFEERAVRLQYWGRKNLMEYGEYGQVDGHFLATFSYNEPVSRGSESLYGQDLPPGFEGGWMNQAGLGLIVDSRDSEFDPSVGFRLETNITLSGSWLGSTYGFADYFGEIRGYFSPFTDLVIAQKLGVQHVSGDVPFWEMPALGNELGLRGYASNRFRGRSSIIHIVEMRSWLFGLYNDQLRFGGQLFMDTGRVFSRDEGIGDITSGLKQTFGIGGAMSVVNPDFVFRGDVAFSEDIYRVYFGVGYLF
ncbi:MAG: BamA/TamA family outer membrane protein [Balneolaceae bacterium]